METDVIGPVDLVITAGRIITLDPDIGDVTTLAVSDGRIVVAGGHDDVAGLIGPKTLRRDYPDDTVLPGMNDAHLHLAAWSLTRPPRSVGLQHAGTISGLENLLMEAAAGMEPGAWLLGGDWRENWIEEFANGDRIPHRHILDAVTGDRPTVLTHASLHARWVNSAALAAAGIDSDTPDPLAGEIVRDEGGEPTGLLLEAASWTMGQMVPAATEPERRTALTEALRALASLGYTSVTDPLVTPDTLRDYARLHAEGGIPLRLSVLMNWDGPAVTGDAELLSAGLELSGMADGFGDEHLRVIGVKVVSDGAPSHRTAWVYEAYDDGTHGGLTLRGETQSEQMAELGRIVKVAHRRGMSAHIHVTGDRSADLALDAILAARAEVGWAGASDTLIHGTMLTSDTIDRIGQHQIPVVSSSPMRGLFAEGMVPAIGAERAAAVFPIKALLDAGAIVADSSDAPVTEPDWRLGVATMLGAAPRPGGTVPVHRRLNLDEALGLWTHGAAQADGGAAPRDGRVGKGRLTPGMWADLAVVRGDLRSADPEDIRHVEVLATLLGGQPIFSAERLV